MKALCLILWSFVLCVEGSKLPDSKRGGKKCSFTFREAVAEFIDILEFISDVVDYEPEHKYGSYFEDNYPFDESLTEFYHEKNIR